VWIVKLALRRPYTFVCDGGADRGARRPRYRNDAEGYFPLQYDIPVVSIIWTYTGISPEEMSSRIVTPFGARHVDGRSTILSYIESSSSYTGAFRSCVCFSSPNVKIDLAIAQITALSQPILRIMPPGIFPPGILKYDASSVPILQLGVSSKTMSEQEIFNYGQNFIRTQLSSIQGSSVPPPYGGKQALVMVDLDPKAMFANGVSAHGRFERDQSAEPDSSGG